MKTYSVLETSKLLGISTRAVQKRCLKNQIRKKDNRYLITENDVEKWRKEIESNEPQTNQTNEPVRSSSQLDLEIESLKAKIKDLETELEQYNIAENERIEVFTHDEYLLFEKRLIEWQTLQTQIIHQEEKFNIEKKSTNELLEHYKRQFEYQKEQSNKILEMHQKLIDTIEKQSALSIQRNTIEAIEKGVINKDTWKREK